MQQRKPSSCGKILSVYKWKIVDSSTEKSLGPNQRGELRLKGDYVTSGYYKMDSSSIFDSEGYLKTGDVFSYDEDGCFYIVDRLKEMFKCRGRHVPPAILEEVLMSHPAIEEAVVIGVPHEEDGEQPIGLVKLKGDYETVTPGEIVKFVDDRVLEIERWS